MKSQQKTRYRVMSPLKREKNGESDDAKTDIFWKRVGTGFENPPKNGGHPTISIRLDALPLGGDLVLFVDDGKEDRNARDEKEAVD